MKRRRLMTSGLRRPADQKPGPRRCWLVVLGSSTGRRDSPDTADEVVLLCPPRATTPDRNGETRPSG